MNIIAVDDELHALRQLKTAILEAAPECDLQCFDASGDAFGLRCRSPAKELLAYLVDRNGAGACRKELVAVLSFIIKIAA